MAIAPDIATTLILYNVDKNILNLFQYTVLLLDEDEHEYHIYTEVVKPPHQCPYCFASNLVGFGRREQLIKDLPVGI